MQVQYLSDAHLEFGKMDHPPVLGDVLVLAGDITVKNRVEWINDLPHEHVVYVMGNHEFYQGGLKRQVEKTREALDPRINFLQNESVEIMGRMFHGSTFWTSYFNGDPTVMSFANIRMNDHRLIREPHFERRFKAESAYREWKIASMWLEDVLGEGDVVVTHHAPTELSIAKWFRGDVMNGAYYSNMTELMFDKKPALWVHGHVHASFDYMIGDTRVVCNPRGYVGVDENADFRDYSMVEI